MSHSGVIQEETKEARKASVWSSPGPPGAVLRGPSTVGGVVGGVPGHVDSSPPSQPSPQLLSALGSWARTLSGAHPTHSNAHPSASLATSAPIPSASPPSDKAPSTSGTVGSYDASTYTGLNPDIVPGQTHPPVRDYPFRLDPFQLLACQHIEARESVLVSAHTSAGKTVVALHAIALALQNRQRLVYTSPIKALSNQKYQEFCREFSDAEVGLITGDCTQNPGASCLVMTTEILRSMLYHGSEVTREVKWVVFDEVHYMRDAERGVVWEECIVLLPKTVRFVFLSATIPNAAEFAGWIEKIKDQKCHVVYSEHRPVPLRHMLLPVGGTKLYEVVDEHGAFRASAFRKAMRVIAGRDAGREAGLPALAPLASLGSATQPGLPTLGSIVGGGPRLSRLSRLLGGNDWGMGGSSNRTSFQAPAVVPDRLIVPGGSGGGGGGSGGELGRGGGSAAAPLSLRERRQKAAANVQAVTGAVELLLVQDHVPLIVFSFSRAECERKAQALSRQRVSSLISTRERQQIDHIIRAALRVLDDADQLCSQVQRLVPLLHSGIGVHHGGLLPILKEITEILFQEGLVRVLYATETFSMGLNMPARAVLFSQVRKFDGRENRLLSGGEYIQISGRAGRRGRDAYGLSILLVDEHLQPDDARSILLGHADPLQSQFRLTYNMLLNLLLLQDTDPAVLMRQSFRQYQNDRQLPALLQLREAAESERLRIDVPHADLVARYVRLSDALLVQTQKLRSCVHAPATACAFLQPGRLAHIACGPADWGWGVLLRCLPGAQGVGKAPSDLAPEDLDLLVLLYCVRSPIASSSVDGACGGDDGRGDGSGAALRIPSALVAAALDDRLDPELAIKAYVAQCVAARYGHDLSSSSASARSPLPSSTPSSGRQKRSQAGSGPRAEFGYEFRPCAMGLEDGQWHGLPVRLDMVAELGQLVLSLPRNIAHHGPTQQRFGASVAVVIGSDGPAVMDPIADLGVDATAVGPIVSRLERLEDLILQFIKKVATGPAAALSPGGFMAASRRYRRRQWLGEVIAGIARRADSDRSLIMQHELKSMLRVLRRLGYISTGRVLTAKGLVATQLSTGHELVTAELLHHGVLQTLTPANLAALCSCLVFHERCPSSPEIDRALLEPFAIFQQLCRQIANVTRECGIPPGPQPLLDEFKPHLIKAVAKWATLNPEASEPQSSFEAVAKIMPKSIQEGTLVRVLRRLDELLAQIASAVRVMGNHALAARLGAARGQIRRGLVFSASLYIGDPQQDEETASTLADPHAPASDPNPGAKVETEVVVRT